MKKTYINPEIEVIKIATMQMLAVSDPKVGGTTNNPGDLLAPGLDWDDDFDEE